MPEICSSKELGSKFEVKYASCYQFGKDIKCISDTGQKWDCKHNAKKNEFSCESAGEKIVKGRCIDIPEWLIP